MSNAALAQLVAEDGFAVVEGVLTPETVAGLIDSLALVNDAASIRRRGGVFAIRNLLDVSSTVRGLAAAREVRALVDPILGASAIPVRGTLFDKVPDANWKVPWHQDLTIAVQERIDVDGYGPWSVKADIHHVQPPAHIMEQMLSVRLHLDDCAEANGALRVIAGSHRHGRIPEENIASYREHGEVICEVREGGALLMRPLLLHASSASTSPAHRRVVHLDYAAAELPYGMRWFAEANEPTAPRS